MVRERRASVDTAYGVIGVALLAAVVLSGLVGCSDDGGPTDDRPEFSGVRLLTVRTEAPEGPPSSVTTAWEYVDWRMTGPHYRLKVAGLLTAAWLDDRTAGRLGVPAVQARPGEQLLLVAVDPKVEGAAFLDPAGEPKPAEVVVDGVATPVDRLPQVSRSTQSVPIPELERDTVVLLIGARPDASVRLRVSDAGRSQELDLHSGQVDGGPDGVYREFFDVARWDRDIPVLLRPGAAQQKMSVGSPITVASPFVGLTTYRPQEGWAAPGRAFLRVPAPALLSVVSDLVSARAGLSYLHEEFDDADVFTFRAVDGGVVRADARPRDIDLARSVSSEEGEPLVFDVPADTTAGTVVLDLRRARLTAEVGTQNSAVPSPTHRPVAWATPPAPVELPVDLGGR